VKKLINEKLEIIKLLEIEKLEKDKKLNENKEEIKKN